MEVNFRNFRKKLIRNFLLGISFSFAYFLGGYIYNQNIVRKYEIKAIQKADINKDSKIGIDEAISMYKKIDENNEKMILRRMSHDAKVNYIRNVTLKSHLSNNITKIMTSCIDNLVENLHYYENLWPLEKKVEKRALDTVKKLFDINNSGKIEDEEVNIVFKIGYGNNPIKLKLDNSKYDLLFLFCPYLSHKGSELERYVKSE